jgi:hypothetical protein
VKRYRLYGFFSFTLSVIKFPLLIFLTQDKTNLKNYFIILSASIAINFVSTEIISFQKASERINRIDIIIGVIAIILSSCYILLFHQCLAASFVFYNISLILFSFLQSQIRDVNLNLLILFEVWHSLFQILATLIIYYFFKTSFEGLVLLYSSILFNIVSFCAFLRKLPITLISQFRISSSWDCRKELYLNMMVTQNERLIISAFFPSILFYINFASNIIMGVKKTTYDDNVLFSAFNKPETLHRFAKHLAVIFLLFNIAFALLTQQFAVGMLQRLFPSRLVNYLLDVKPILFLYSGIIPMSSIVLVYFRSTSMSWRTALFNYTPSFLLQIALFFALYREIKVPLIFILFTSFLHFLLYFHIFNRYFECSKRVLILLISNFILAVFFYFIA